MVSIIQAVASSCFFNRDRELIAPVGSHVRLIKDTEKVRQLFLLQRSKELNARVEQETGNIFKEGRAHGEVTQDEFQQFLLKQANPNVYTANRGLFLDKMSTQPSTAVPEQTYARIIERSDVKCFNVPFDAPVYLKVRLTTGVHEGDEGWVCDGDFKHPLAGI